MCQGRKRIPSGLIILIVSEHLRRGPDVHIGCDSELHSVYSRTANHRSDIQCWNSIYDFCSHIRKQTLWLRSCTQVLWHSVALCLSLVWVTVYSHIVVAQPVL